MVLSGIPQLRSGFTLNSLLKALPTVAAFPLVSGVPAWTLCVDVCACGSDRVRFFRVTGNLKLGSISRGGLKRGQGFL